MQQLLRRLWHLFRRRQLERDLREELEFRRAIKQRELADAGHTLAGARIATRRALGSVALAQDQIRDVWMRPTLDALVDANVLCLKSDGTYARLMDGELPRIYQPLARDQSQNISDELTDEQRRCTG